MKIAMWMFASLFIIPVITNAAAQSCPANQIASEAQIILYGDTVNVIPENVLGGGEAITGTPSSTASPYQL